MKNKVKVELPIRINFGGAWSDTPPFCQEQGGCVCNTSALINGKKPIKVEIEKIEENKIVIENENKKVEIESLGELSKIEKNDEFLLVKKTLIAQKVNFLGLHIKIDTNLIPRGSGLGTSSILILAILEALYLLEDKKYTDNEILNKVMYVEKLIGTGGGWQDQVGAFRGGIKLITTLPGTTQNIKIDKINISQKTKEKLNSRFVLVYTGETREASKIVKEIMEKYIKDKKYIINIINKLKEIAKDMKVSLEEGNIDEFAKLLSKNYENSLGLSKNILNKRTNEIFEKTKDLTCGKMICGAGNGGFIELILKKGITKEKLNKRLEKEFPNTNIKTWEIEIE